MSKRWTMLIASSSRRSQTTTFPSLPSPVQTTMTSEITEILDRLQACEAALEMHRGYLKAMEYGLRVSLLTHQNPLILLDTWTRLLPSIAHSHHRDDSQQFSAAFQQSLTVLTEQIGGGVQ